MKKKTTSYNGIKITKVLGGLGGIAFITGASLGIKKIIKNNKINSSENESKVVDMKNNKINTGPKEKIVDLQKFSPIKQNNTFSSSIRNKNPIIIQDIKEKLLDTTITEKSKIVGLQNLTSQKKFVDPIKENNPGTYSIKKIIEEPKVLDEEEKKICIDHLINNENCNKESTRFIKKSLNFCSIDVLKLIIENKFYHILYSISHIILELNHEKCPIKNNFQDILILILNKKNLNRNICVNLDTIIFHLNESPVKDGYKELLEFIIGKNEEEIKTLLLIVSNLKKRITQEEYIIKFYEIYSIYENRKQNLNDLSKQIETKIDDKIIPSNNNQNIKKIEKKAESIIKETKLDNLLFVKLCDFDKYYYYTKNKILNNFSLCDNKKIVKSIIENHIFFKKLHNMSDLIYYIYNLSFIKIPEKDTLLENIINRYNEIRKDTKHIQNLYLVYLIIISSSLKDSFITKEEQQYRILNIVVQKNEEELGYIIKIFNKSEEKRRIKREEMLTLEKNKLENEKKYVDYAKNLYDEFEKKINEYTVVDLKNTIIEMKPKNELELEKEELINKFTTSLDEDEYGYVETIFILKNNLSMCQNNEILKLLIEKGDCNESSYNIASLIKNLYKNMVLTKNEKENILKYIINSRDSAKLFHLGYILYYLNKSPIMGTIKHRELLTPIINHDYNKIEDLLRILRKLRNIKNQDEYIKKYEEYNKAVLEFENSFKK